MATKDKGTSNESIGRPKGWREGRYQRAGQSLDDAVASEPPVQPKQSSDPRSTPVHLDEYTKIPPGRRPRRRNPR
jgi:hypothetical protein